MCFIRNPLLQTDFLVVLNFHRWFFPTVALITKPRVLYILRTHSATELCWPQPCTWVLFILFSPLRIWLFYLWGPTVNPSAELSQLPTQIALARGEGKCTAHKADLPTCYPSVLSWLGVFFTGFAMSPFFWILHLFLTFGISNCTLF